MLYKASGGVSVQPRSYLDEVRKFDGIDFPIANRKEDIGKLLTNMAYARKPNLAIVGKQGTGKTITLKYIISVLTGEKESEPEWKHLFDTIREKIKEYQARDYLFLPNLQDPNRPVVLDFVNDEVNEANNVAKNFCKDVNSFFKNIGLEDKIYPEFTEEEFETYLTHSIKRMYETLYYDLHKNLEDYPAEFNIITTKNFGNFKVDFEFLGRVNWDYIRAGLRMRKYTKKKDGEKQKTTKTNIQSKLRRDLKFEIVGEMTQLLSIVHDAKVSDYDLNTKQKIAKKIFENLRKEYSNISRIYKKQGLVPYYSALRRVKSTQEPKLKLSEDSVVWVHENLENILEKYKSQAHDKLVPWLSSVVRYFTENKKILTNAILEQYLEIRGERVIKDKDKKRRITLPHPFASSADSGFSIFHGSKEMKLEDILSPKKFICSKAGEISIKYPNNFSEEKMWGKIGKPEKKDDEDDDDDEPDELAPHRKFMPGYVMESSIIMLPDNMQGFIKALLGSEEKEATSRRQLLLTFFEEGNLIVEQEGISFNIHSPTMVIGCDTEWPFVKPDSLLKNEYDFDTALESRFTVYEWDILTQNTPKTRKGTIGVIHTAVNDFNEEERTSMTLKPKVIDQLLIDFSLPDLVWLDYRLLDKRVRDILGFGRRNNINNISLEHLMAFNKELEEKSQFHFIDTRIYDQITEWPLKAVGQTMGVALLGCYWFDLIPIRSAVIPDIAKEAEDRFQLYHLTTELATDVTKKGFVEAVDFVKRQLDDTPIRFISKTTYHQDFDIHDGPSASLANAVAICSALSEKPIYSRNVYTGTLSFSDGSVGAIGGILEKSLAVWRTNQKLNKNNKKRMRFMFPAENLRELQEKLRVSPRPIAKDIDLVPINNFQEAFWLGTTNYEKIDVKKLPKIANQQWGKTLKIIKKNVMHWNKQILTAYKKPKKKGL